MRKFYTSILLTLVCQLALAQWPANYDGVMLQGFYWDSYDDTQWTNLTAQADELSKYFDLIWVPNSANCHQAQSMGYMPVYWFDQRSSFGREKQLRTMIETFKEKGTGIIEDVVLNHKAPYGKDGSYIDFVDEKWTWNGTTYDITWSGADICNNDDGGYVKSLGFDVTGANDTGEDFSGARDLDHTSANVQKNAKLYLQYLLEDLGYAGFRLDMVKGYGAQYTKLYNEAVKPTYCVGEYWDGYDAIVNWIKGTGYTSAAFDFPLKFQLNKAFAEGNYSALSDKGLSGDPNNNRYSVSFVDNHDTEDESYRCQSNQLGATAFILAMPGTPCIFLKHWKKWSREIGNMILTRKAAGVNNQSAIEVQEAVGSGYVVKTRGTKGSVMVLCGNVGSYDTTGFKLISKGGAYAYYVSDNVEVEGLNTDEPEKKAYKVYVYANSAPNLYAWDNYDNPVNGEWPGTQMTDTYTSDNGTVWFTSTINSPSLNIVLSNGSAQTANIEDLGEETYIYYSGKSSYKIVDKNFSSTDIPETGITVHVNATAMPYLYAWDSNGTALNGEWPGEKMVDTETSANGTLWYVTMLDAEVANIIINDGNGNQSDDIENITDKDVYFTYDGRSTVTQVTADYEAPEPTGISIFVNAATAPYLYSWEGVGGEHTGTWPGTQMSEQTTTDDGKTWWKHTFEADVTQVNIILNNGNGSQTSDIQDITSDRYFTYDGASTFEDVTSQYLDVPEFELPDCAVYLEDKLFIYFEAPSTYPTPYVWAWNDNGNLNGTEWPGTGVMENVGTASNGNEVYRFIFEEEPTGLLFSNAGSPQTSDFNFVNGGYYTISGQQAIVKPTTGVKAVELATDDNSQAPAYNLAGQRVGKDYRGLVIVNGRKQFRP